ncbi:leucine-rich repeat domain-containing protein, partial [Segatella hominis]|uniref:leucine-rich repeat domain-containing protein n=1 Tax=Segatella hominis TaxID=2518605 RepID=UPI003AB49D45
MKDFTLRKRFLDSKSGTSSLFKGFVMLVVLMLMTTSSAMAQDPKFEVIDGFRYLLDSDTKTATLVPQKDGDYSGDIIIPEKVKGNDGVEYIVASLGASCFEECSGLTSITIPSSVTSLGASCFAFCDGLTSITIPSSVTSLGASCFEGCRGLTSITIPSSVTSLGASCFDGCSGLTSITIPSSVTSLGDFCFRECSGLTSITIPSSVTSLVDCCFYGCKNLETVYFKGKKCNSNYKDLYIPQTSIIKVPKEYLQDYKDAFGSDYKYIYAWNPDETGEDNKPVTQCSTPSISYESGKLMFACETTGAKYHYTITDTDIKSDALSENGEVSLSAAYNISVYATADGYKASDKAEATLYWINANL